MFCIINLRHNSSYVAPPAGGRRPPSPPPPPSMHAPSFKRDICVFTDSLIRDVATRVLGTRGIKIGIIGWENVGERWIFISMKVVVP